MDAEFRHHLSLRTDHLVKQGLSPEQAARQARLEFGHIQSLKEDARASRGLSVFDEIRFSMLDVKLGMRMMRKYPGLTLVSLVGMTVAIAIAAGAFGFLGAMVDPTLPLPDGERLVSIQNIDLRRGGSPDRQSAHDFAVWRTEASSITELSAFMTDSRNLIIPGGESYLVRVALITPVGLAAARVPPALGRALVESDEYASAPQVVVIAYDEWLRRFQGDSAIIGTDVRLGTTIHTVVGVMPPGFAFPINHRYWVPLRLDLNAYAPGEGPAIYMFGWLAPGSSIDQAQAELSVLGLGMAAEYPATHEHLRPQVLPYTHPHMGIDNPTFALFTRLAQIGISVLLVVVAVNVSILVYARTATRRGEIAIRTALGASRRRVVAQLFAEALLLSSIAATVGLTLATVALEAVQNFQERTSNGTVFWLDLGPSPGLVAYVAGLAVLAGVIVGVVPALKSTGRGVFGGLQQIPSRGSPMELGRTWTLLIVAQVAITVAALPTALFVSARAIQRGAVDPIYPADQMLQAFLSIERPEATVNVDGTAIRQQFLAGANELRRRLESESAVAGVTIAKQFPGFEGFARVEVEGIGTMIGTRLNDVDVGYLEVFEIPILAGRSFVETDTITATNAIIVDRVFVDQVLGGGNAVGRRVRLIVRQTGSAPGELEVGPWLEIVGVTPDFSTQSDADPGDPTMYRPAPLNQHPSIVALSVRIRNELDPASFAQRLRDITVSVDPALQLHELRTAADAERERQEGLLSIALLVVAVTTSVLLLSAAGIYAMMSFTVTRRRREIGIRTALGADRRRLLTQIFGRVGTQLAVGAVTGLALALLIEWAMGGGAVSESGLTMLPVVVVFVLAIGLLAAIGPARRGLSIQPSEALGEE